MGGLCDDTFRRYDEVMRCQVLQCEGSQGEGLQTWMTKKRGMRRETGGIPRRPSCGTHLFHSYYLYNTQTVKWCVISTNMLVTLLSTTV